MINQTFFKKNIKVFKNIASAISKENINILIAKDNIGSYYNNNLILPNKIDFSIKNSIKKKIYIYKILFSITSKKLNFYIKNNKENIDYKQINTLLTIKKINKIILKAYSKFKNIKKILYPIINKNRYNITNLTERALMLEIILKKLTYQKINKTIKINVLEKEFLFKVENLFNITEKNLENNSNLIYDHLIKLYKNYSTPNFFLLWGYLYNKNKVKKNLIFKNKIKNKIKKYKNKNTFTTIKKLIQLKKDNTIQNIFDYKKTYDTYSHGNKNVDKSSSISESKNANSMTDIDHSINLLQKSQVLMEIDEKKIKKEKNDIKKITYKEWDYKKNSYKNDWCHLFIKKLSYKSQKKINISEDLKKEINLSKKYFKIILNKKQNKKNLSLGDDIDIDSIIDNYNNVKNNNFNKIYIKKIKNKKDLSLLILLDSSLSTESYSKEMQTLDKLKNIAYILSECINTITKKFIISTFHSNTRYDCKYLIIKDLKEKWEEKKHTLFNIKSLGYTRIGPALRHSIHILKNIKAERKIILLLSDGNPTDYDEYEGSYGLLDIKKTINEAKKNKINIKGILINNYNIEKFVKIFDKSNCIIIKNKLNLYNKIKKIFT